MPSFVNCTIELFDAFVKPGLVSSQVRANFIKLLFKYFCSKPSICNYNINKKIGGDIPVAETIYKILWEKLNAAEGFVKVEKVLV